MTPTPTAGKTYALRPPFLATTVVAVDRAWIHLRLSPQAIDLGAPARIKRKHWSGKDPVELTPELRGQLLDRAARVREAEESGVPMPQILRGGGLGSVAYLAQLAKASGADPDEVDAAVAAVLE